MRLMKNKIFAVSAILIFTTSLAGCRDAAEKLGIGKTSSPDEFLVVSHPPLSVPPNFTLAKPTSQSVPVQMMTKTGHSHLTASEKALLSKMDEKRPIIAGGEEEKKHFIDPDAEKARIAENQKKGLPINQGEVKERPKAEPSTLQKIFGR